MESQLKAVFQQSLQHRPVVLLIRSRWKPGLNVKPIVTRPLRDLE